MDDPNRPIWISVIVPVYNVMEWLPRCVDSIRRQTYRYIEIILVDDGSTDTSGALAEKMALEDKRIKVIHKNNGGTSSARNAGIAAAGGEYIGFVDSDDYIEPQMYERLLTVAMLENLLMVQISRDEIDENGNRQQDVCIPPDKPELWECRHFMRELLLHRGDCSFCTKLTRASLLKEGGFREGELNEDFLLLIQLLPKIPAVAILPEQEYHVFYRYGSNTRTRDKNEFPRVFTDIVNNADLAEEIVLAEYSDLKQEAIRFSLFQRLDYLLHIPIAMMNEENEFYKKVKNYLRNHIKQTVKSPYLTAKNKIYLLALTIAPKMIRCVHGFLKKQ